MQPRLLGPALLAWLLCPGLACAHALVAECTLKGGTVEVVAFYDDDSPAAEAVVKLLDGQKQVVARGRTDARGRWSLPAPAPGEYEVVVDAGAGHRAAERVTVPGAAAQAPVRISEGPGQHERASGQWVKLLIGLLVIGGLGGAFLLVSRFKKSRPG